MDKIKKKPIKYFFIAIVLLIILIYVFPIIPRVFATSYTLEYGELKLADEAEACYVRDEKVYIAGSSGKSNYYINEGDLVRKGTKVMDYSGTYDGEASEKYEELTENLGYAAVITDSFLTEDVGTISYYIDGNEGKLNPSNMGNLTFDKFKKFKGSKETELKRDGICKGEPVFKVVDREGWYIVAFVNKDSVKRYEKGQNVKVIFKDGDVDAEVKEVSREEKKLRVVLEVDNYYKEYAKKRCDDIEIITYDGKGLIVNNSSIKTVKDQEGVYVRNKTGDYDFVPVQVYLTDGEKSIVADKIFYDNEGKAVETVEVYDEILKNPK